MPCAESLRVHAYLDRELEVDEAAAVEAHLEACADCRALLEDLQSFRKRLRALPPMRAPDSLRADLTRALDAQAAATRPAYSALPWRARPFWQGVLAGAGAAALATCAALWLLLPPSAALLDGLVAAHVRSLMSEHLTDVVSSDRHTVKPWFAGHADVSPAVADFTAQGYRLVGGRADYLDHQRAAVLVYQHGAHVINVFSWNAGRRQLPARASRDGYHVVCWQVADLEYCAVSDAGWDELTSLKRLFENFARADARE